VQISNWDDLVKAFAGNFQGTYVRPGNSWCNTPGVTMARAHLDTKDCEIYEVKA
jgi:hypothetical protein